MSSINKSEDIDMLAARINSLPSVPTWGLIANVIIYVLPPFHFGFSSLSQCFLPLKNPGRGLQQSQSVGPMGCGSGSIAQQQLQGTCSLDPNPAPTCQCREGQHAHTEADQGETVGMTREVPCECVRELKQMPLCTSCYFLHFLWPRI